MFIKDVSMYYFLRILRGIVARVSNRAAHIWGSWIGSFAFHHIPIRKKEARIHLEMAFPNHSEDFYQNMLKKVYQHFGTTFIDILRINVIDLNSTVQIENQEILDRALNEDKGVILLSGHFGNWELIAAWLGKNGYNFYPIIRKQKNRGADRFFVEIRQDLGTHPIYRGAPPREMLKVLRKKAILGLASDQDARKQGVFVDFFGIPSSTPKGAAIFHLKTGAPLIMSLCHKDGNNVYHIHFQRIHTNENIKDSIHSITAKLNSILENAVRQHPEQYFWFHRRWKTKPPNKVPFKGAV